jgi:hypothetical protein
MDKGRRRKFVKVRGEEKEEEEEEEDKSLELNLDPFHSRCYKSLA